MISRIVMEESCVDGRGPTRWSRMRGSTEEGEWIASAPTNLAIAELYESARRVSERPRGTGGIDAYPCWIPRRLRSTRR